MGAMSALPARAAEGPLQFYTITPCRVVDTRLIGDVQGRYGPYLTSGTVRKFPVRGNCGIPADARAVSLNVTGVGPSDQGHLVLFPSGTAAPRASNLNFDASMPAVANGAIVGLSSSDPNDLSVLPNLLNNGRLDIVLDVTGYFKP